MSARQGPAPAAAAATSLPTDSPSPSTVVLCALPREAQALGVPGLRIGAGAALGARTFVTVTGAGPTAAAAAVDALAPALDPSTVLISLGVAGALRGELNAGDVILANRLIDAGDGTQAPLDLDRSQGLLAQAQRARVRVRRGGLISSSTVLASAADKTALARRWPAAHAVDMESCAYARAAVRHGLSLIALRVIIDEQQMSIPPAALSSLGEDGETRLARLIGSLLRQPTQLPALLSLGRAWQRARHQLLACGRLLAPLESL